MYATASRPRRSSLTNVVVRQSMRTGAGSTCALKVHVFQILDVIQAAGPSSLAAPSLRIPGVNTHQTFQNVCSYYDVKLVVRYEW